MTYNLTSLQDSLTISNLFVWANDATGQILFGLFLLATFFVMLIVLKKYEFRSALVSASWITFILSVILRAGGLVPILYPIAFLILVAGTMFYLVTSNT